MAERIVERSSAEMYKEDQAKYSIVVNRRRAIPEVKDGLKVVQRRVLYGCFKKGAVSMSTKRKSASITGDAADKYHPHGTSSLYETIVGLVNWFKNKVPLMYGKGGWGNVLGDGASAERYTECAVSGPGYDIIFDELKQTPNIVEWIPTYQRDGTMEPEYLPTKIPILLINGAFGIGVGMLFNVPSHNMIEVIEATRKLIKNPKADIVLVPDLCQRCELVNTDWKAISNSGSGTFKARGKIDIEVLKNEEIILHLRSVPDNVSGQAIYDKLLDMAANKELPMVKEINISTTKAGVSCNGMNIYELDLQVLLKKGSDPNYVKQVIYARTDAQKNISVNFEAVSGTEIKRYSYKDYLLEFIDMRTQTKFRYYCNKLQQCMTRYHKITAYIAVQESGKIDQIIDMIRKQKSKNDIDTIERIIKAIKVTDLQARFIIESNIKSLSLGYLNDYRAEAKELKEKIAIYEKAVSDDGTIIMNEIDAELVEMGKKYGQPRMCTIIDGKEVDVPKGTFKIIITEHNYIRKIPENDKVGIVKRDNPKFILKVDNAESILLFDNKGKVFNLPVSKVPITDRNSSGTDIRILVRNLTADIISVFYEPIFKQFIKSNGKMKHYMVVVTKSNTIKKLDIEDFTNVSPSGLMYSKIKDNDEVVGIALCPAQLEVAVCSGHKALRMTCKDIPLFKRNASGSKAMDTNEPINGLSVIYPASDIVVVTANGKVNKFGINMFPAHSRARKGSGVIKLDSNDEIFNIYAVNDSDKIRFVTSEGIEEVPVNTIKSKSTIASGTKVINAKAAVIIRTDIVR